MSNQVTILITGLGSGVAQSVLKALKYANIKFDRGYCLIGTDASYRAAGLYVVDRAFLVPLCSRPDYLPTLAKILNENRVDFIIPGTDPEVEALGKGLEALSEMTDTHILVNPPATIETGFDKYRTHQFLKENGLPYPATALLDKEGEAPGREFPFIVKPRYGSGSVGMAQIRDEGMLVNHLRAHEGLDMIAQEYIDEPDSEYTCGLLFDHNQELVQTIIMRRILKKGYTQFAQVVENERIEAHLRRLAQVLPGRGSYNVQGRLRGGEFIIFEINPRFSGTTAFRAVAGLNEPDIYIQQYINRDLAHKVDIKPMTMIRFLNECYVDSELSPESCADGGRVRIKGFTVGYF